MADLIQVRRDAAARWEAVNPVLADGELGYDRDHHILKIGDGMTPWNDLSSLELPINAEFHVLPQISSTGGGALLKVFGKVDNSYFVKKTLGGNRLYLYPFVIYKPLRIDRLGMIVTGYAGHGLSFGIYSANDSDMPDRLLVSRSIDAVSKGFNSAGGDGPVLRAGRIYWAAVAAQQRVSVKAIATKSQMHGIGMSPDGAVYTHCYAEMDGWHLPETAPVNLRFATNSTNPAVFYL